MQTNTTKQKLNSGETVYGAFFRTPDTSLIELQGYLGWDFLVLDGEHGTLQPRDVEDQCRACELHGVTPIARATTNEQSTILRFMDTGAQGALIPFVNTDDDAERAVQSIKYQPRGKRGLAGIRAANFGRTGPLGDYVKRANEETLVIAQIETTEGLANLDAIVKTPDVDVIFIGPNDLANSLGHPGNIPHPDVQAAMDKIATTTLDAGKILGLMIYNSEGAQKWRDKGARFISVPFEAVMTAAVTNFLEEAKQ
ncbi:MAG: hypothetical protein CMO74_02190 [Verrucomicrobiales bacterium]|nr:hypothetical protein [Verrucomicrobiales bacterium]|tara:strand:+ start:6682 stop:7443 length:762 start_codon:yes stop_codon:yes gene_type:complete